MWLGLVAIVVALIVLPEVRDGFRIWFWAYVLLVLWFLVARTKSISWSMYATWFAVCAPWSVVIALVATWLSRDVPGGVGGAGAGTAIAAVTEESLKLVPLVALTLAAPGALMRSSDGRDGNSGRSPCAGPDMNIGVLGTGQVGQALGGRLVGLGHDVVMGSREASNQRATEWAASAGPRARAGTFADAAAHGEIVINATAGGASLQALELAGEANLGGRVLVDVSNPMEFVGGSMRLTVANTDSLAEQIQRAYPEARVVKTPNTMNNAVMVNPARLPGDHNVFIAGDDAAARAVVRGMLTRFGWAEDNIVDLGGLSAARGLEMYLPLWLAMMNTLGTSEFNIHIVRGP